MDLNQAREIERVALVTGAAGGIGRATVQLFADSGWRVIGVDRAPFQEGFPSNGLFIQSDISIGENLESIFSQAHAYTGRLDALINNAALQIEERGFNLGFVRSTWKTGKNR